MHPNNSNFSEKSSSIEKQRPRHWEYLLLAQLLEDEISSINFVLDQDLGTKLDNSENLQFRLSTEDLKKAILLVKEDLNYISNFATRSAEVSSDRNESAFGPPGTSGNPILLQMIAKRAANLYYEIAVFAKIKELEITQLELNSQRIPSSEIEAISPLYDAIRIAKSWSIKSSKNITKMLNEYSNWIRLQIEGINSGDKNSNRVYSISAIDETEVVTALNDAVNSIISSISGLSLAASKANEAKATKPESYPVDSRTRKFTTLMEVAEWLSESNIVLTSDLKKILLPFDCFPGVLIDEINQISLELFEDIALEEFNDTINVNQEILSQSLPSLHSIQLFSEIHDLKLGDQSSCIRVAAYDKARDVVNDSHPEMTQEVNIGDDIYLEAMNYDLPYGIYPQDKKEALRLYKKAADLGCLKAYTKIGEMYEEGEGISANEEKAIEYYRKGANCGNVYCYYKMASFFIGNKRDLIDSQKCFQLFAEKLKEIGPTNNLMIDEDDLHHIAFEVVVQCQKIVANDKTLMSRPSYFPLLPEYNKFVMQISLVLSDHVIRCFEEFIAKGEEFNHMKRALEYFRNYAKENAK